jgi:Domain of unknown function (DUF4032)/Lipopolysaccharide kinase (Kdo/WaaP) family
MKADTLSEPSGLLSFEFRPGSPDFSDLPWELPLARWDGVCPRLVNVPRGLSRHDVRFVGYPGGVYAFKELPPPVASREYELLLRLEERRLPAVTPVGHAQVRTRDGETTSMLVTRHLDGSLPYRILFRTPGLERYRDRLLDAIAGLLVRLHLAGFYWGDCSLSNTLFRRDAGELQAYLVDAETSDFPVPLTDAQRRQDLYVVQENVAGELFDVATLEGGLPKGMSLAETGGEIRRRYDRLWSEVTREEAFQADESFRMHERITALNALGFSVGEIEIVVTGEKNRVRLRTIVTDRDYHRHQLHSLTGVVAEERQAQAMLNEIREVRAWLSAEGSRSVSLSEAGFHWLRERFDPAVTKLAGLTAAGGDAAELYCQVLEHKWFLSEREKHDVGFDRAIEDYLRQAPAGDEPTSGEPAGGETA